MKRLPIRLRVDRKWWVLAVALAAGGAAAWLSQRHIQARIDAIEAEGRASRTQVVVAARDLEPGMRVSAESAAVRELARDWLPADFIDPSRFHEIEGAALAQHVRAGAPLLPAHLENERQALAQRLEQGRRAVTIPVDEISSVSGLLEPGDLIDLYVSLEHRGKRVTVPLLQKMRVLATGHRTEIPGGGAEAMRGGFSTVTLDATPEEAVKLIAAREGGVVTAMLRRPGDGSPAPAQASGDLPAMLGLKEPAAPAMPRKPSSASVIYGDRMPRRIPGLGEEAAEEAGMALGQDAWMGTARDASMRRWEPALPRHAAPPPAQGAGPEAQP
ncbi:SAF domain protein [Pigmentiphaga humi]|uniref:SAF domain protein n=1 Tax=Pigmentiphaga humi TaxID=2478468 RepID=A0A3P4B7B1_9BURK|nr:Flp pilus assembly protein CpaB [Pigmentiphaga humi]VCU71578.1 SAF domain protein [Pigmentiphaga humi]